MRFVLGARQHDLLCTCLAARAFLWFFVGAGLALPDEHLTPLDTRAGQAPPLRTRHTALHLRARQGWRHMTFRRGRTVVSSRVVACP